MPALHKQTGLISPERRSQGGFRLYSPAQVERLRLIKRMRPLGFHSDQMRELLAHAQEFSEQLDQEVAALT